MDSTERTEVREMIHDVLSGWHAETVAREEVTNMLLKNINDHLGRINGSVARHEKIIIDNLPHTIANCPQNEKIQEIRDDMITIKTLIKIAVFVITTAITIFTGYEIFFK